jgi:hypothetical protein
MDSKLKFYVWIYIMSRINSRFLDGTVKLKISIIMLILSVSYITVGAISI